MDQRTLRDVLNGQGISAAEFRVIALDLAGSLAAQHAHGITHGWLTPESVAITSDGHAEILGFGAPTLPFDPQPDLQALGKILFEMSTGHPAVEGADANRVPLELRPIIGAALARHYNSAEGIVDDLRRLDSPTPAQLHGPRRYPWVIAALVLIVAAGIWWKRGHSTAHGNRHAVTVLYFANLTKDPSLDWLIRGLPEMVTIDLQQSPSMEVITLDRQAEALLRHGQKLGSLVDGNVALDTARDAGADIAVTGAILRDGASRLKIEVHEQGTGGGRATTFTLSSADGEGIVKLTDELSRHLINDVNPRAMASLAAGHPSLAEVSSSNFDALRHIIAAREMLRFGAAEPATQELQEALRLDPQSALGNYEMAEARGGDLQRRYDFLLLAGQHPAHLPRYERLHFAVDLAGIGGDTAKLRSTLQTLLHAFPRDTASRNDLALRLGLSAHPNTAIAAVNDGLALDPEDATLLNQMVYACAMAGDEKATRAASDKYLELHPNDLNALDTRGETFYILGNYEESMKAFRKVLEVRPDALDYATYQKMALILAEQGSFEESAQLLAEYGRRASPEGQRLLPMYEARLAEATGDLGAAAEGYLRAAQSFNSAGRTEAAGEALLSLANVAILSGENLPRTLAAVKSQKALGEELPAVAWLAAVTGDKEGAERSLREYYSLRPWLSPVRIDLLRTMGRTYAALAHKDQSELRTALASAPDDAYPWLLYARGEYARALSVGRALFLPPPLESPSPLRQRMIREKLGIKDQSPKPAGTKGNESIHV